MSDKRYVWVDNLGYVEVGENGIPDVQQHVNNTNAGLNSLSNDDIRVRNTGNFGWRFGGDLMDRVGDNINPAWGQFSQESWDRFHDAGGRGNPLIDTNPNDIAAILELYKSADWNPFMGRNAGAGQAGSVADYLFSKTKGISQLGNRDRVMRQFEHLANSRNGLANAAMTEQLYNEMKLGDIYGAYDGPSATPPPPTNAAPNNGGSAADPSNGVTPPPPSLPAPIPDQDVGQGLMAQAAQEQAPLSSIDQLTSLFGNEWQRGTRRSGTWGSGHNQGFTNSQFRNQAKQMFEQDQGMLGDNSETMRQAVITALENKLLG